MNTAGPDAGGPPLHLEYVTDDGVDSYNEAIERGFHNTVPAMVMAGYAALTEPERSFGFRADTRWVATCGAYTRTLVVPGGPAPLPVAAVTGVTVAPAFRRSGLMRRMLVHQLDDVRTRAVEPLALLWASDTAIYGRFGYGHATPHLRIAGSTVELRFRAGIDLGDGWADEVEVSQFRSLAPAIRERAVADQPGVLNRPTAGWDALVLDTGQPAAYGCHRYLVHTDRSGCPDGYAIFRVADPGADGARVRVIELEAVTAAGFARLWRLLLDLDLVPGLEYARAAPDHNLLGLLERPGQLSATVRDGMYVRLVDVASALTARRYLVEVDVVIDVRDDLLPGNAGRYRMRAGPDGAEVTRVGTAADVHLDVRELGAAYLGGVSMAVPARLGLVEVHHQARFDRACAAFGWTRAPRCPDMF